jgi:hypothetical protein
MGLWSLHQDDAFYEEDDDQEKLPSHQNIWHILCKELGVSVEQKQRIKARREKIRSLSHELHCTLRMIDDLRRKVMGGC